MQRIDETTYRNQFNQTGKKALEKALDIRKFEIDLYWKRATYFWTFNAAAFAGYAALAHNAVPSEANLLVIIACFGLVLSFAWYLVNRGSKQWQHNWEYHVDMLEDLEIGPLYKTVLTDLGPVGVSKRLKHWTTGPGNFSVSKINITVSLFAVVIWIILILRAIMPFDIKIPLFSFLPVVIAILAIILMLLWGRTSEGESEVEANSRTTKII